MIEGPSFSFAFIKGKSSLFVVSDWENMDVVGSKAIPEGSAAITAPEAIKTKGPLHEQPTEVSTDAQDISRSGRLGTASDVVMEASTGILEPPLEIANEANPLNNARMAEGHEEEVVDYEGSAREELAMLSSNDDEAWDPTVDTLLVNDTNKSATYRLKTLN